MVDVFREVRRRARKDGTLWLNLGDSYAATSMATTVPGSKRRATSRERPTLTGRRRRCLKPKDLVGIPWRVAFALQADGWYLRSVITWRSQPDARERHRSADEATSAVPVTRPALFPRPEAVRESGQPGTHEAIRRTRRLAERSGRRTRSHPRVERARGRPIVGTTSPRRARPRRLAIDATVKVQSQLGAWGPQAPTAVALESSPSAAEWEEIKTGAYHRCLYCRAKTALTMDRRIPLPKGGLHYGGEHGGGVPELQQREGQSVGSNLRDWWVIATEPYKAAHFATFPRKLVEPCVKAGSSERGVCPECGAPWVREVNVGYRVQDATPSDRRHGPRPIDADGSSEFRGTRCRDDRLGGRPGMTPAGVLRAARAEPVPAVVLDPFAGSGRRCWWRRPSAGAAWAST